MPAPGVDVPHCPVDLTDPALYADGVPYDLFRELRSLGPVLWHGPAVVPDTFRREGAEIDGFWAVLGHPEIVAVNRDHERFRSADGPSLTTFPEEMRGTALIWMDAPDHTRLRKLISAGFTPRMLRRLDELLVRRTTSILEDAAAREQVDLVSDLAYPLPMHVIADIVGIPESDRPHVFTLTDSMMRGIAGSSSEQEAAALAQVELFSYAEELSARKLASPEDDVWSTLANASVEAVEGGVTRLGKTELDFFFVILSIAGSETTRNAISQGLVALLDHPAAVERLRSEPDLVPTAVEEMLRWSSPVLYFGRTAVVDVEVGGVQMSAGDRVSMWYPAGNRDARTFADPDTFDPTRSPNPHVAFGGGGAHFCLGANLARREVAVMVETLLRDYELEVVGPPQWGGGGPAVNVGVSLDHLPVRLARAGGVGPSGGGATSHHR